jgi:hypothetical protein
MNRDMICCWLGLADKRWPPDPYALLGLNAEQCDAPSIEKRVHERMGKLRCYQLLHPEEATEGMTRVAQAYITLIERHGSRPEAKAAPAPAPPAPATMREPAAGSVPLPPVLRSAGDTAVAQKTKLDWQAAPPPVRGGPKTPRAVIPVGIPEPQAAPQRALDDLPPAETAEQVITSLAEASEEARGGLVTLQAVIERADRTRQLLIAWRRLGRYLGNPKRRVTRGIERGDFARKLEALLEAAERHPEFVAHPGRPGYRAVALAHLQITPDVFNAMGDEPREQLARDWTLAHRILLAHRRFLLRQFKVLRRQGRFGRVVHALRSSFRDHPALWTGLAAAVGVAACVLVVMLVIVG